MTSLLDSWRGREADDIDTIEVPVDLTTHFAETFGRCDESTSKALEVVAVLGPHVSTDLLAAMLDELDHATLEALSPAERQGIVREVDRGTIAFSHDLLRERIYADTPSVRRARIHGAAARALAAIGGASTTRAAWHACRSVPLTTADHAVELALAGAGQAEHQYSFDTAGALYAESLSVIESRGPDSFRPVALLGLARCMTLGGRGPAAVAALLDAERSVTAHDDPSLDEQLMRSARVFARFLRGDPAPTDVLARLTARLPSDTTTRVHAATEHMLAEFVMNGWTEHAERSALIVEAAPPEQFEIPHRLVALFRLLGGPDAASTLDAARRLLSATPDEWWDQHLIERVGYQTEISSLLMLGRLGEASERAAVMAASTAARSLPVLRWMASVIEADIALTVGDFDGFRLLLDELLIEGQEWEIPDAVPIHLGLVLSSSFVLGTTDPRLAGCGNSARRAVRLGRD
ncbi:MAG: hypothetical protein R2733_00175 [Acidimicrobiales bacterium]